MFFNNKFNTFFGLNLTLVYTFPMCMAWRFHFPIRNYDFKVINLSNLSAVHKENNAVKIRIFDKIRVTLFESNLQLNWKRMSIIKVGLHEMSV